MRGCGSEAVRVGHKPGRIFLGQPHCVGAGRYTIQRKGGGGSAVGAGQERYAVQSLRGMSRTDVSVLR
jgi:hypothetical protein